MIGPEPQLSRTDAPLRMVIVCLKSDYNAEDATWTHSGCLDTTKYTPETITRKFITKPAFLFTLWGHKIGEQEPDVEVDPTVLE